MMWIWRLSLHMTLAAGHGAFFHFDVTVLALLVICHAQAGLATLGLECVAFGAPNAFGALALNQFAVLIDVVAPGAILDLGLFVMLVMVENADRTLEFPERFELEPDVIILGKSRNAAQRDAEHDRAENYVSE
jgi:hypothetical protein